MGLARTDALVRVHRAEGVDPRVHPLQRELDWRRLVLEVADGRVDDLAALAAHQQPRRADIYHSASVSRRSGCVRTTQRDRQLPCQERERVGRGLGRWSAQER